MRRTLALCGALCLAGAAEAARGGDLLPDLSASAANFKLGQAKGGREGHILRAHAVPRLEHDLSGSNVFAYGAGIGAALKAGWQNDTALIVQAHIFLHEDGVGPIGHSCSSEYPRAFARLQHIR